MEKLMDIYNQIQDPIENPDSLKRIIKAFSKNQRNLYGALVRVNSSEKRLPDKYYKEHRNHIVTATFKTWKNNIIAMTPEKYNDFYGDNGYYSTEFIQLREYLKKTEDFDTEEKIVEFYRKLSKNENLKKAFEKYTYEIDQGGWEYLDSHKMGVKRRMQLKHRLYVNTDCADCYPMLSALMVKFMEKDVPFCLKYSDGDGSRDDTIVMWVDDENLPKYIELLREIAKEHPDFIQGFSKPPIVTGTIDGWIGYGSEPEEKSKNLNSFNKKRREILEDSLTKATKNYFMQHKDKNIEYQGKQMKFLAYFALQVYDKYMEKANSMIDSYYAKEPSLIELAKEYFKEKDTKQKILNYIYGGIEGICNGKEIKDVVCVNFANGKKISYSQEEVEQLMYDMAYEIAEQDSGFVNAVREEIRKQSKDYGIDENKFCFDINRVKNMQEYDRSTSKSQDINQKSSNAQKQQHEQSQKNTDTIPEEQKEIEEILKKVINLTPENRKKAFQLIELLQIEQEVKERK